MADTASEQRGDNPSGVSRFFRAVKDSWRRETPAETEVIPEPPREAAPPEPEAQPAEPAGPKRGGWWQQNQK
jgi:hypothetical protein